MMDRNTEALIVQAHKIRADILLKLLTANGTDRIRLNAELAAIDDQIRRLGGDVQREDHGTSPVNIPYEQDSQEIRKLLLAIHESVVKQREDNEKRNKTMIGVIAAIIPLIEVVTAAIKAIGGGS